MAMSTVAKPITPEELLSTPNENDAELVDGELVRQNRGWNSSWVGGRLHFFLCCFCEQNPIGKVVPADGSYQCFPDAPEKVRKPDASFIRRDRLPKPEDREGHCRVAPDIAAEVISPHDLYSDVEVKVDEYLSANVQLVWVVNPRTKSVRVHRADGSVSDLTEQDTLNGESVMPGFECLVANLFRDATDD
jgi:Uma2 family endonuclease